MSKRKRTEDEVEVMQEKSVRFQESVGNDRAASRIEKLSIREYAAWRNIQIVSDPVRKRKRRSRSGGTRGLPPGFARSTEITEWTAMTETGIKRHREVRTEIWKKEQ